MLKFELICIYLVIIVSMINTALIFDSYDHVSRNISYIATAFPVVVLVGYVAVGRYKRKV